MKKTLFIFRQYASYPKLSGGIRHYEIAKELIKHNFESYIFTASFNHHKKKDIKKFKGLYITEEIDGINFVWVKSFPYYKNNWRRAINIITYGFSSFFAATSLMKKNSIRPDYVIGSVAHFFSIMSAYFISKKGNSKYIIDVGDLWPEVFVYNNNMKRSDILFRIMKGTMHYFYKRADLIMCLSKSSRQYFIDNGYKNKSIVIAPSLPIDSASYDLSNKKNDNNVFFDIVYIGSFQVGYHLKNVIEAAAILKNKTNNNNIRFILIGDGETKQKLINSIHNLTLSNIILEPSIPKNEVSNRLKNASAFLLIQEETEFGFPNKLLDYTKAAKPILYATPTKHEILEWPCCIQANYDDPLTIAESAEKLSNLSADTLKKMSSVARAYFEEKHDIEVNISTLQNALFSC